MDEEVIVTAAAMDAVGDEENLTILAALLSMIVEEDEPRIGGSAWAPQEQAEAEDRRLLHIVC